MYAVVPWVAVSINNEHTPVLNSILLCWLSKKLRMLDFSLVLERHLVEIHESYRSSPSFVL